jgi:DNA-binding CsgD family transcriptional regulator
MASTDLTPIRPAAAATVAKKASAADDRLIRRPAELVELAELVYRGVFAAGLGVAAMAALYATLLSALQPAGQRAVAGAVCAAILLGELVALHQRSRLYPALRTSPWLGLIPALAIGAGAWAAGERNQQLFYVLTILMGTLGAALPLRATTLASLAAAGGLALPHVIDGSWAIGESVAAGLLPPLLWLILEQLAQFMLRLHQAPDSTIQSRPAHDAASVRGRSRRHRRPGARSGPSRAPLALDRGGLSHADRTSNLTARQVEVLLLSAEGLLHREIAEVLQIGTVQPGRILARARAKVGVTTDAELVAWAIREKLIPTVGP